MTEKRFLILSEESLTDFGWLEENIEKARERVKKLSEKSVDRKFFILAPVEYGMSNLKPCTFYAGEVLTNVPDVEENSISIASAPQALRTGRVGHSGNTFIGATWAEDSIVSTTPGEGATFYISADQAVMLERNNDGSQTLTLSNTRTNRPVTTISDVIEVASLDQSPTVTFNRGTEFE